VPFSDNATTREDRPMLSTHMLDTPRSLIDVTAGERVAVGAVLFEVVRNHCSAIGIQPGIVMDCEICTSRSVLLRRDDGVRVELDRVYAAFVEVQNVH
jgi:hypothetical protein